LHLLFLLACVPLAEPEDCDAPQGYLSGVVTRPGGWAKADVRAWMTVNENEQGLGGETVEIGGWRSGRRTSWTG
jgi:hypothetical protein